MLPVVTKHFEYTEEELNYLIDADATLGAAIKRIGKVERIIIPDLFAALVYAIVGQLISVKAADAIWGRMQSGLEAITPESIAAQTPERIKQYGLTAKKAAAIHEIAVSITEGTLSLQELHDLSDDEVIERLVALKGIGKWTAEMLLINSMERRNVVSWGDAAIRRGMMRLYGLEALSQEQFNEYRQRYSPYGSIASLYLWELSHE